MASVFTNPGEFGAWLQEKGVSCESVYRLVSLDMLSVESLIRTEEELLLELGIDEEQVGLLLGLAAQLPRDLLRPEMGGNRQWIAIQLSSNVFTAPVLVEFRGHGDTFQVLYLDFEGPALADSEQRTYTVHVGNHNHSPLAYMVVENSSLENVLLKTLYISEQEPGAREESEGYERFLREAKSESGRLSDGSNLLHFAISNNFPSLVKLGISIPGLLSQPNASGKTPRQLLEALGDSNPLKKAAVSAMFDHFPALQRREGEAKRLLEENQALAEEKAKVERENRQLAQEKAELEERLRRLEREQAKGDNTRMRTTMAMSSKPQGL